MLLSKNWITHSLGAFVVLFSIFGKPPIPSVPFKFRVDFCSFASFVTGASIGEDGDAGSIVRGMHCDQMSTGTITRMSVCITNTILPSRLVSLVISALGGAFFGRLRCIGGDA